MNVVMIIPTGIGCEIGGHAGDANPAAKLLGSVCDTLFLHPNVVNASDINEMPQNSLYVEGSILDRFLEGKISLRRVKSNRVLVAVNPPLKNETVNAVSAARSTIGLNAEIVVLDTRLRMIARMEQGRATGDVEGWKELLDQVQSSAYECDAVAIASEVEVDDQIALDYLSSKIRVNPWGGVEAKASRLIAEGLDMPVAHAPIEIERLRDFDGIVDPRKAPEMISITYLQCVLKGLHKAPRIVILGQNRGLTYSAEDVDCLVTPIDCLGPPHEACLKRGIPIIAVEENTTALAHLYREEFIYVKNYLEAAGLISAMTIGITAESVGRPLEPTRIKT